MNRKCFPFFNTLLFITTILLIVGLLTGPWLVKVSEIVLGQSLVSLHQWEVPLFEMSYALCLSFCSVCAGWILFLYSKTFHPKHHLFPFVIFLLIILFIASIIYAFRLLLFKVQVRYFDELWTFEISINALYGLLRWSVGAVVVLTAVFSLLFVFFRKLKDSWKPGQFSTEDMH